MTIVQIKKYIPIYHTYISTDTIERICMNKNKINEVNNVFIKIEHFYYPCWHGLYMCRVKQTYHGPQTHCVIVYMLMYYKNENFDSQVEFIWVELAQFTDTIPYPLYWGGTQSTTQGFATVIVSWKSVVNLNSSWNELSAGGSLIPNTILHTYVWF